jgi:16S rRNA (cytidine1402-2'-O)-methyltransferase
VFYESPYRLVKTLGQIGEFFDPERKVSVSREISKLHEENARGTALEVLEHFKQNPVKGEIVIIVEGHQEK